MKFSIKRALAVICISALIPASFGCGKEAADKENGGDSAIFESTTNSGDLSLDKSEEGGEVSKSSEGTPFTVVTHPLNCEVDGIERAYGMYPEVILSDETRSQYPQLADSLKAWNETTKKSVEADVAAYALWAAEDSFDENANYSSEITAEIVRFDDRIFTMMISYYAYSGGAHPGHYVATINIDPVSGNEYSLKNVLSDSESFPQLIRDKITADYPELIEEIDSFYFGDNEVFADKLKEETYTFTVTDKGLYICFSPYEIASYATGYIDETFSYEEYPDLIQPAFRLDTAQDMSKIVTLLNADMYMVEPKEFDFESDGEAYGEHSDSDAYTVANPSWKNFNNNTRAKENPSFVTLSKTKEDKSDWLDTEVWAVKHGFELASMPYSDDKYHYDVDDPIEYSYMYNEIKVTSLETGDVVCDYDLNVVCNGPDEEKLDYSHMTQYIRWAQIVDDILYVSVGHAGYASEESWSNYMIAIDLNTNELIWRSVPLVSNASNFKIVDDTIICGYGFTAEPDYIYLLDRYTGQTVSEIPVVSAASQFEIVDDTLYVATYNTAYEFKINK